MYNLKSYGYYELPSGTEVEIMGDVDVYAIRGDNISWESDRDYCGYVESDGDIFLKFENEDGDEWLVELSDEHPSDEIWDLIIEQELSEDW